MNTQSTTVLSSENNTNYAAFFSRFVATIIDGFIINIPITIATYTVDITKNPEIITTLSYGMIIIFLVYGAYFESSTKQATPGKMALGIKVTDTNGQRLSFGKALARNAAKILSTITLLIGYIMAAFTKKKQGLHDMVAGTLVVK